MDQQPPPSVSERIATAALNLWSTKSDAAYATPPISDSAFDCSYFVWLAIKTVNPHFVRESSAAIAADRLRFEPVLGPPQVGDIVYFPKGQVPYEVTKNGIRHDFPAHVAIMLSSSEFVGMQSKGVGRVKVPDTWWWPRKKEFFRYKGPAQ